MAFTYRTAVSAGSTNTTSVTAGLIGTTTSDLLVVGVASYVVNGEPTLSDSQSNTWTGLNHYDTATLPRVKMYYCVNPSTSSSHDFTLSQNGAGANYCSIAVLGVSGAAATPLDQQNGATVAPASTIATGTVTPTENNEILITTCCGQNDSNGTVDTGFTVKTSVGFSGGVHWSIQIAYKIQTSASTEGATWNLLSSGANAASIASFKAAADVGHPTMRRWGGTPFVGGQGVGQKGSSGNKGRMWGRTRSGILVPSRFTEAA